MTMQIFVKSRQPESQDDARERKLHCPSSPAASNIFRRGIIAAVHLVRRLCGGGGGGGGGRMKIIYSNLRGEDVALEVAGSDTIDDLKAKIQDKEGLLPDHQILYYCGRNLDLENCRDRKNKTLADFNLREGSFLYLALRLRGG